MKRFFDYFATKVTEAAGSVVLFVIAFLIIVVWAMVGPIFKFSDSWQLVINTGTTIITFLMVFVIQRSQNKDTKALHLKLNELIASSGNASNRLIDIEDLTTEEIDVLKKFYVKLSKLSATEKDVHATHSLDEAVINHDAKIRLRKTKKDFTTPSGKPDLPS